MITFKRIRFVVALAIALSIHIAFVVDRWELAKLFYGLIVALVAYFWACFIVIDDIKLYVRAKRRKKRYWQNHYNGPAFPKLNEDDFHVL